MRDAFGAGKRPFDQAWADRCGFRPGKPEFTVPPVLPHDVGAAMRMGGGRGYIEIIGHVGFSGPVLKVNRIRGRRFRAKATPQLRPDGMF